MANSKFRYLEGAIAAALVAIALLVAYHEVSAGSHSTAGAKQSSALAMDAGSSLDTNSARFPPRDRKTAATLEKIKNRWLAIIPQFTGIISDEERALARESVRELGCSIETIRLLEFLDSNCRGASGLINKAVSDLFRSDKAAEARNGLSTLPDLRSSDGVRYRDAWGYEAGKGCSLEEFTKLSKDLGHSPDTLSALLGYNSEMSKNEPAQAFSSTVTAMLSDRSSSLVFIGIQEQIKNLPDNAPFNQLESMLPAENTEMGKDEAFQHARSELFRKWGQIDPAGASNYVIANPERIGPKAISRIAAQVMLKNALDGFQWVQEFPDGPYFDAAASASIPYMNQEYPKEATELASMISDPKLREESLKMIRLSQEAKDNHKFGK